MPKRGGVKWLEEEEEREKGSPMIRGEVLQRWCCLVQVLKHHRSPHGGGMVAHMVRDTAAGFDISHLELFSGIKLGSHPSTLSYTQAPSKEFSSAASSFRNIK